MVKFKFQLFDFGWGLELEAHADQSEIAGMSFEGFGDHGCEYGGVLGSAMMDGGGKEVAETEFGFEPECFVAGVFGLPMLKIGLELLE